MQHEGTLGLTRCPFPEVCEICSPEHFVPQWNPKCVSDYEHAGRFLFYYTAHLHWKTPPDGSAGSGRFFYANEDMSLRRDFDWLASLHTFLKDTDDRLLRCEHPIEVTVCDNSEERVMGVLPPELFRIDGWRPAQGLQPSLL